jgi:hypothetical protein
MVKKRSKKQKNEQKKKERRQEQRVAIVRAASGANLATGARNPGLCTFNF